MGMKSRMRLAAVLTLGMAMVFATHAAEWYVSLQGDHSTGASWGGAFTNIQAALDAASPADTIFLAGGQTFIWTNQIVWAKGQITMLGGHEGAGTPGKRDPRQWPTVLTRAPGSAAHRIMYISAGDAALDGVAITGGSSSYGAGLHVAGAQDVRLNGCAVTNNAYSGNATQGGGIYAADSSVTISNCIVRGNRLTCTRSNWAANVSGGGIWSSGTLGVHDSLICDNDAINIYYPSAPQGGGIHFEGSSLLLHNALLAGNNAHNGGAGGLYAPAEPPFWPVAPWPTTSQAASHG